ncbi:DUF501 domain-containing protein [Halarsenatibacter silvermanii]|uniref:DUF501 domain-containing protein n=1 Tax=Halarsenatibacter silvermanii TaxID=321763 RepID=A0A1G9QDH2_9FIRM|nr:DUF501 domain-containing protein [Halarsenatibacter silvermanii]SDM08385.1 hypothetical protein SAMN04488692_11614 [Halarsenatibacter silvermanii]
MSEEEMNAAQKSNSSISAAGRRLVEQQLGRSAKNALAICDRCSSGFPRVVKVHPFFEREVFPTTYWLTCPRLKSRVQKLEDEGLLDRLTEKEKSDEEFARAVQRAHEEYAQKRRSLMDEKLWKKAAELSRDVIEVLKNSGVGGIRTEKGLKCLHTHLAHYLAGGNNPVGRITAASLEFPTLCRDCSDYREGD